MDSGFLLVDSGFLPVDSRFLLVDFGFLPVDTGFFIVSSGFRQVDPGFLIVDSLCPLVIPGSSHLYYQERRKIDNWEGGMFLYSCSAQSIIFEIDCFSDSLWTPIYKYGPLNSPFEVHRKTGAELVSNSIVVRNLGKKNLTTPLKTSSAPVFLWTFGKANCRSSGAHVY